MRTAILVPCYKRPEYTEKCIRALENAQEYKDDFFFLVDDGSNDNTADILVSAKLPKSVITSKNSVGLRRVILDFFNRVIDKDFDYISKVDNDCIVPKTWLDDILGVFSFGGVDILSPNVNPSQAAHTYGKKQDGLPYLPSKTIGGLWTMRKYLIENVQFENHDISGIRGAFQILNQIIVEKEPVVGWLDKVTFEDIGHWSGTHPQHIPSEEHRQYSVEVGRRIAW